MACAQDSGQTGGWLIHETFAWGNARFGKPSRDAFLLKPGELLEAFASWHVVAFEQGLLDNPVRQVQRIAVHPPVTHPAEPLDDLLHA